MDDTFRLILTVVSGYGRFVLIVAAGGYLLMGHGWAAAAHFTIAVVMFALFYRYHRAREQAIHERLQLEQEEFQTCGLTIRASARLLAIAG